MKITNNLTWKKLVHVRNKSNCLHDSLLRNSTYMAWWGLDQSRIGSQIQERRINVNHRNRTNGRKKTFWKNDRAESIDTSEVDNRTTFTIQFFNINRIQVQQRNDTKIQSNNKWSFVVVHRVLYKYKSTTVTIEQNGGWSTPLPQWLKLYYFILITMIDALMVISGFVEFGRKFNNGSSDPKWRETSSIMLKNILVFSAHQKLRMFQINF